jgi:electron transport complex protein RnfE
MMTQNNFDNPVTAGLWRNNPALVQLLGICPLLAVTTSLVNGLALGLATTFVILLTNFIVGLVRKWLLPAVRILIFVLIIASLVTVVDLLSNAYFHDLHEVLGLFIPLIVTNCAILGQAETIASRHPLSVSVLAGLSTGLGFTGVLTLLGGLRELVGNGTVLANLQLLLGSPAASTGIELPVTGILVAVLPPGAFFGLAFLVAAKNYLDARRASATTPETTELSP